MEAKHRAFKNCIADRVGQFAGGVIPAASLPRLLLSHVHGLISTTSSSWACESRRNALQQHLPRDDRSTPLAAKEARLPHVSVACGDVLRTRDKACRARECCDNGSLLFIVQELRFDPSTQLAPFVSRCFVSRSACAVASWCTVRASAGASWWALSANMKTRAGGCGRRINLCCAWSKKRVAALAQTCRVNSAAAKLHVYRARAVFMKMMQLHVLFLFPRVKHFVLPKCADQPSSNTNQLHSNKTQNNQNKRIYQRHCLRFFKSDAFSSFFQAIMLLAETPRFRITKLTKISKMISQANCC